MLIFIFTDAFTLRFNSLMIFSILLISPFALKSESKFQKIAKKLQKTNKNICVTQTYSNKIKKINNK